MSAGDRSGTVDLKTITAVVGVVGAIAAAAGSWYVNSYRIDQLEKQDEKVMQAIQDTKCLVADAHDIMLPECHR
jgi:hypothetical protein